MKARGDNGFTLIELMFVVAIIALLGAITVPSLLRARIMGNEAAATAAMRTIFTAQQTFAASCGRGSFAGSLEALAIAPSGSPAFLPADLASGAKQGYTFTHTSGGAPSVAQAATCNNVADAYQAFFVAAAPLTPGATGGRYFGTNETGLIRQHSATLTVAMTEGTPIQ